MLGRGLDSLIPQKNRDNHKPDGEAAPRAADLTVVPTSSVSAAAPATSGFRERPHFSKQRPAGESVFQIETEKIKPNPYQPRRNFSPEELTELAQSIREHGVIQPLIVTKVIRETATGTTVEYQLVAGERRLLAAKQIGLPLVPVIIRKIDSHQKRLELALIENLQRSDLSPLETARAYSRLQEEFSLTQREIAAQSGKSREAVANTLRLLNLPADIQEALLAGKINESQARMLLGVTDPAKQKMMFGELLQGKTTVRQLRDKIAETPANPEQIYLEKQLEEKLGAPVKVFKSGGKGKLVIQFYSDEEWRGLIGRLIGETDS